MRLLLSFILPKREPLKPMSTRCVMPNVLLSENTWYEGIKALGKNITLNREILIDPDFWDKEHPQFVNGIKL